MKQASIPIQGDLRLGLHEHLHVLPVAVGTGILGQRLQDRIEHHALTVDAG